MTGNKTLTMIKPDAMQLGHMGKILDKIISAGFTIRAMKLLHLSRHEAELFYIIHKDRPFYAELVGFMSSGPIVAAVLEKENAVEEFRQLVGATNPAEAAEGTIRKMFGTNIGNNAVHGSDSDENATIEGNFFFSQLERV
jgi:nucleoside-diphosphate kinase